MIYPNNFEIKIGFDRIRETVERLCVMQAAREKLARTGFLSGLDEVARQLRLTDQMRTVLMMEPDLPQDGFVEDAAFLRKAAIEGAFLEPQEIFALRRALSLVGALSSFFAAKEAETYPDLKELAASAVTFPALVNHIDTILDRFGNVKDNASPELLSISRSMAEKSAAVSKRLQQILKSAKAAGVVDDDTAVSIRDGRAVIPVPSGNKRKIKGFVHDESATGRTSFIEPVEVVELNNELKELEYARHREIVRILTRFTDLIRPDLEAINGSVDFLAEVDFIRAKAKYALESGAVMPIVSDELMIGLRNARHPLLEKTLKKEGKSIVPLNMALDGRNRILVISGPNAGGKSVCLKTVGLLQYMLQCGFLIPASENSEMGLFGSIFIDIGDEQSIDNDLSTYSSHLLNMRNFAAHADDRSLVLIDEFGTGTEPVMGGAIAEAVLERLVEKRVFGVITTHYSNLKYFAANSEGVINGAMMFDVQKIQPLFALEIGKPGSSFAFEIARKIGLPENIIQNAALKIDSDQLNIEKQLRQIARDRRYWEGKRDRIRIAEKRIDESEKTLGAELSELKDQRSRLIKQAKQEAAQILAEANRTVENTIRQIRESQAGKEETKKAREGLDQLRVQVQSIDVEDERIARKIEKLKKREEAKLGRKKDEPAGEAAPLKPKEIEVGDKVRIRDQSGVGEVISIEGNKAVIGFGQMLTTIARDRLEAISNTEFRKAGKQRQAVSTVMSNYDTSKKRLNFSQQIDLRGMRAADALMAVEEYIDEAIVLGVSEVRILHGKGTGALKQEIRNYLRTVGPVESAVDEHEQFGGAGITVVKLGV